MGMIPRLSPILDKFWWAYLSEIDGGGWIEKHCIVGYQKYIILYNYAKNNELVNSMYNPLELTMQVENFHVVKDLSLSL